MMEQFVFFRSYYEALKDMPQKVQAEALMAIAGYMLDDIEPELSGVSQAIFVMAKPSLDKSKARSAAGKKGGSVKQNESKTKAKAKQTASKSEANPEQTESKQETIKDKGNKDKGLRIKDEGQGSNITVLPTAEENDGFDEFWDEYPRHVAKQAAKKAWDKLKPDAELRRKIISAIREQKKSDQWTKDGGNYIPHPATWLNQARWEDELPQPAERDSRLGPDRSQSNGTPGQHEYEAVQRLLRQHRQSG